MNLPIPHVSLAQLQREAAAILRFVPRGGVAVFDADGTLWAPDVANRIWKRILSERALRSPGREAMFAAMAQAGIPSTGDAHHDAERLFAEYFAGKVEEEIVVRIMINALAGCSRPQVDALVGRALHQEHPLWADEEHAGMADFVRWLHLQGVRVVICSGSPLWAVQAGANVLGLPVEIVLAGDVVLSGEHLTTEIIEPLTFRGGKGRAYDKHIGVEPIMAFGDGESDIPLLERATHLAVAVNPRPSLVRALPQFGTRARVLLFGQTRGGRFIKPPAQDESVE